MTDLLGTPDRRIFLRRAGGIALGLVSGGVVGCVGGVAEVYEPSAPSRSVGHTGPLSDTRASNTPASDTPVVERVPPPLDLLPVPDLSDGMIIGTRAGLRPYRRGGVRLELSSLPDGRPIVHDYGHGGAGITLAWGCAEEVRDLLRARLEPPATVAVLGAGIVGMTAAWVLGEAGYGVTLYAQGFTPATTSDVAGGQWAPSLVDLDRGLERRHRLERILRRSFRRYLAHVGERYGVFRRDNYVTPGHGSGLARIPGGILPPVESLDRLPFPGPPRRGRLYRTLLIEPPTYLPRLLSDLEDHGVARVRRSFDAFDDLATLPDRAVVNCLGLGARDLLQDKALIPVRGQLVHLRPQALPYLVSHEGYIFPRRDAVVLGGTSEWNVSDTEVSGGAVRRILERHRAFFSTVPVG